MKNKRRDGAQPEMKSLFKGVWGWCPNKQPGGFRDSGNLPVKPSVYRKALLAKLIPTPEGGKPNLFLLNSAYKIFHQDQKSA